ncbi:MAG TPA: serine/threonine-protein kinase [Gaiellaceae bacterium]|nr:serine/threonine-protein kinase [Gaiellaceae bacterium]
MPAPVDTSLPPRYRDARLIAHGGMGEIFLARDEVLGRDVAVKVLAKRYALDESLRERFKREALAAARLSGNHSIVTIFDVGEHDGRPIIVMEYLAGGSLEQRIDGTRLDTGQVLDWLDQAAAALDAAHEAGIVHRDVKPGNLLLDHRDHVKVADFGIASAAGMDSFTQTGTILGTAGYLAPEQARGERATSASDRYALAVVAWELLTGRRPFQSEAATTEALAHVNAAIPSVRTANWALPASFDAVFQRALAKDPATRYAHASEFVAELRAALHDDEGDTRLIDNGWAEPAPRPAAPMRVGAQTRGRRWWIPALLVAMIAGGALAAVLASNDPKQHAHPRTVIRTVTGQAKTVHETVTAPPAAATGGSGSQLNLAGYRKMQAGDYAGALPLLEQAVQKLNGTGSLDEAYASYNLAYTRYALGDCTDVLALLDHAQSIEGKRSAIQDLRHRAKKAC